MSFARGATGVAGRCDGLRGSVRRAALVGATPAIAGRCDTTVAVWCGARPAGLKARRYAPQSRGAARRFYRGGVPWGANLRSTARIAQPKLAWSETSASTSVPALPAARITTAGPIAPDGLRCESAPSRRGAAGTESEGEFPPCGAGRCRAAHRPCAYPGARSGLSQHGTLILTLILSSV